MSISPVDAPYRPAYVKDAITGLYYRIGGGGGSASPGRVRSVISISSNTTALAVPLTDYIYICSNLLTLTLPTAVGNANMYTVKRTGVTDIYLARDVTIATTAGQTIDEAANFVLDKQYMSIDLISTGTNWVVV